ncbi:MAG: tRNA lysidine(34) synthetase TilS [Acidobacteriota bacterium]
MPGTLDRVRRFIERGDLIPQGSKVLAAVSGGSDSVGLLVALADLAGPLRFTLVGLAHLNHQLRGVDSEGDEAFCRRLAARLGLACEVGHADVRKLSLVQRTSIEVAARTARYRFLDEAARRLSADLVATGHTRDDQAETMLLHLFRGAGRRGLGGIPPRRGRFVRPLLEVGRQEVRALASDRGFDYREDATNADRAILRNWIRHGLLPLLNERLGGELAATLARQSRLLREEDEYLDSLARQSMPAVVRSLDPGRGRSRLDAAGLRELPRALARRVLRLAADDLGVRPSPGAPQIEAALDLAAVQATAGAADLPGLRVERNGETVVLLSGGLPRDRETRSFRYDMQVPGRLEAATEGFVLEARLEPYHAQVFDKNDLATGPDRAMIDAACAAGGLRVRSRKPGDALVPLGMTGRRKLQDVLVDRKVPREARDRVPVIVDGDDAIVWVAGIVQSEHSRVTDRTQSVVTLTLSRLGEWP